jgi:hypothetical protein
MISNNIPAMPYDFNARIILLPIPKVALAQNNALGLTIHVIADYAIIAVSANRGISG